MFATFVAFILSSYVNRKIYAAVIKKAFNGLSPLNAFLCLRYDVFDPYTFFDEYETDNVFDKVEQLVYQIYGKY